MESLATTNLIRLFDFYLATMFLISTTMRVRQYEAIVRLAVGMPERWPKLLRLIREHHMILFSWQNGLPAIMALVLLAIHSLAGRLVWPYAELTLQSLARSLFALAWVGLVGLAMAIFDAIGLFWVGKIDRALVEGYFDQAEYWLRSWASPVVRVFTFGYINPRRMVATEVRKALEQASRLLNQTLWWVSVQTGLRISFGLSLWLTWALGDISCP